MGAVFASTRFSLVRISIRDLAADGKSLVRNSGVGGGGQNLILIMFGSLHKFHVIHGTSRNCTWKAGSLCVIDGASHYIEIFWGMLFTASLHNIYVRTSGTALV